jgi:homoserine kinase
MTVAFREGEAVHALHVANHLALGIALFVPEGELRTDHAREMIPASVPLTDAVFDLSRLGYFVTAMMWGRWDLIGPAMEDRLHQPYRAPAIPALDTVIRAAREAGAYGAALSGGGPSVIALCRRGDEARIGDAMCEAASAEGWRGNPLLTGVRERGVTVRKEKASEDEPTPSE